MKEIILFSALCLTLAACTSETNSQKGPVGDKTNTNGNVNTPLTAEPKKDSAYPPLATAASQAVIKNLDGSTFKIEDKKGKVLLLNMWATWCGPCRGEMPHLVKMQDEYRDQGFEVIGLNTDDETPAQIEPFAKEMKLNYQLAWPDETLYKELLKISRFQGIPQSFLIDRDGRLRGVFLGGGPNVIKRTIDTVSKVIKGEDTSTNTLPQKSEAQQQPPSTAPDASDSTITDKSKSTKKKL